MIPIHSNLSFGFPMYLDPPWRVNIEPWGFQNIQPEFSAHRGIPVRSSTSQAAKPFRCVRIGSPSTVPLDFFSRNEGFLINGDTPSSHPLMDFPLTIQLLGTPILGNHQMKLLRSQGASKPLQRPWNHWWCLWPAMGGMNWKKCCFNKSNDG